MTDHKCNECVRMTVSQDEYISILEQQIEELKEFAENIVKASADNPDEFFELKKENESLGEKVKIYEAILNDVIGKCDVCSLCEKKGQYLPECKCMTDNQCLCHMFDLYLKGKNERR